MHVNAQMEHARKHVTLQTHEEHKAVRTFQVGSKSFWFCVIGPLMLAILFALSSLIEPMRCVTSVRGKSAAVIAKGYPGPLSSLPSLVVVFFDALWLKVFQTR
ncbi:hypothetical protein, partial [Pseudomonas syringae]|uniref:hypothetical protein n=1 Tax=Pseudomonas syringae TaxID=317 RepID=UPI001F16CFC1